MFKFCIRKMPSNHTLKNNPDEVYSFETFGGSWEHLVTCGLKQFPDIPAGEYICWDAEKPEYMTRFTLEVVICPKRVVHWENSQETI